MKTRTKIGLGIIPVVLAAAATNSKPEALPVSRPKNPEAICIQINAMDETHLYFVDLDGKELPKEVIEHYSVGDMYCEE